MVQTDKIIPWHRYFKTEGEQGFIDNFGIFMDRVEALAVAKASGQPLDMKRNGGSGDELYSEGLY